MKDTSNYVEFPCEKPTWPQVRELLDDLKNVAQHQNCNLEDLAKAHQVIVNVNANIEHHGTVDFGTSTFYGLVKFLRKHVTHEEKRLFLQSTLPAIIDMALELPNVIPFDGILYSRQQCVNQTELSRRCVASILACAFLCLFEDRDKPWRTGSCFNVINFNKFFLNLPCPSQNAKIRCILSYFEQVAEKGQDLQGNVVFIRQVIPPCELPTMDTWLNCRSELCPLISHREGVIEDAGYEAIQIDFANRYIGGGVLGRGRVQEEIRFTVCPELIASMLFMECMDNNEAIVMKGHEQYTQTSGYAASLQYVGRYSDPAMFDVDGNLKNTLCAIDAISYKRDSERQYEDRNCLRDLNKAYVGFCVRVDIDPIALDLYSYYRGYDQSNVSEKGSVTDEEFLTADEGGEDEEDGVINSISNLAEGLVVEILSAAMIEACSFICQNAKSENKDYKDRIPTQNYSEEEVMDYLDVDAQDWYTRFRRRSSNLSDITSRRSSCEIASRRSSCSRPSSEFSSEFEEFYDNFQRREMIFVNPTITEEDVCNHAINDFAASLVASILHQGTCEAAHVNIGVQKFHDDIPQKTVFKPKARKASEENGKVSTGTISPKNLESEFRKSLEEDDDDDGKKFISSENTTPLNGNSGVKDFVDSVITASVEVIQTETAEKFADQLLAMIFPSAVDIVRRSIHEQCSYIPKTVDKVDNSMEESKGENSRKEPREDKSVEMNDIGNELTINTDLKEANVLNQKILKSQNFDVTAAATATAGVNQEVDGATYSVENKNVCTETVETPSEMLQSFIVDKDSQIVSPTNVGVSLSDSFQSKVSSSDVVMETTGMSSACENPDEVSSSYMKLDVDLSVGEQGSGDDQYVKTAEKIVEQIFTSVSEKMIDDERHITMQSNVNEKSCNNALSNKRSSGESLSSNSNDQSTDIPKVTVTDEKIIDKKENKFFYEKIAEKIILGALSGEQSSISAEKSLPQTQRKETHHVPHKSALKSKSRTANKTDNSENKQGSRKVTSFASSLSRDLLTNAFVEVQRNYNGGNYYRRSSEPLQLPSSDSLGLKEISDGDRASARVKSRAEEDIGSFVEELDRHGGSLGDFGSKFRYTPCGFRDPTLSRFAEELMKSECKVPELLFLDSTNLSTSGSSSRSRQSSISGFKESILATFEDELLNSSFGRTSSRGSRKRSKKVKQVSIQRNVSIENSLDIKDAKYSAKGWRGMSFDSEASGISWLSFQSSSPNSFDEISDYADRLAQSIIEESLHTVFRDVICPSTTCQLAQRKKIKTVDEFAEDLANNIILESLLNVASQNRKIKQEKSSTEEVESIFRSEKSGSFNSSLDRSNQVPASSSRSRSVSDEYTDAFDIPYTKLEAFAQTVAQDIIQTSAMVFKREKQCELKRKHGRPISTGNWGCGAFGGDPCLKSMLQWIAASYAGVPYVLFYTFQHPSLFKLQQVVDTIVLRGWRVGHLMQAVRRYCHAKMEKKSRSEEMPIDLFDYLLFGDFEDIT